MKKCILGIACLLFFAGCQKENNIMRFKAYAEEFNSNEPKMYMGNDNRQHWASGDVLWGGGDEITLQENNGDFWFEMQGNENGYQVGYPSGLCTGGWAGGAPTRSFAVTFKETQPYREINGQQILDNSPMVGYASDANAGYINFWNVGSLLKLTVTNNTGGDFVIGEIIAADYLDGLNGNYNVVLGTNGQISSTTRTGGETDMVHLTFAKTTAPTLTNGQSKTFYIAVGPIANSEIDIAVYEGYMKGKSFKSLKDNIHDDGDGTLPNGHVGKVTTTNTHPDGFSLERGKIYTASISITSHSTVTP